MEVALTLSPADLDALADRIAVRLAESISTPAGRPPELKVFWTEQEAAAALGLSPLTLKKWRLAGWIPSQASVKPVLYSKGDIDAAAVFITTRRQTA